MLRQETLQQQQIIVKQNRLRMSNYAFNNVQISLRYVRPFKRKRRS